MTTTLSPVTLKAVDGPGQPERTPALEDLYRGFEQELLVPLWTEIGDLMPTSPRPAAQAHLWRRPHLPRRGDFLLPPGWRFHGHHNQADQPMAWLDGLDIPFVHQVGSAFFELGPDEVSDRSTPARSRAERLWAHPGLRPVSQPGPTPSSP